MAKDNILLFTRHEKKYILNDNQYEEILKKIQPFVVPDLYANYTICNIYFDTDDYKFIRLSLEKPKFKEKMRLRSYGIPKDKDKVFLEIKKKYRGVVYKRRIKIFYEELKQYIEKGELKNREDATFSEIDYFYKTNRLKPKVYLAYERLAFADKDDPSIRITFDYNIRGRTDNVSFDYGDGGVSILPKEKHLMELKAGDALPIWLVKIMSELKVYPSSFSKYGKMYQEHILQDINLKEKK